MQTGLHADTKLKKYSQHLYKNTEQWLNQQMLDSQREIVAAKQEQAQQMLTEFLTSQTVSMPGPAGKKTPGRMLSANKNGPLNIPEIQSHANQQFYFAGNQHYNNTQAFVGNGQVLGQLQLGNLTQPLDLAQLLGGQPAGMHVYTTIQPGTEAAQQLKPQPSH